MVLLLSYSFQNSNSGIEKEIVIKGKINNYANHKDKKTIQIIRTDIFDRDNKYNAIINENGDFRISFLSAYTQEYYLNFGTLFSLFCYPGDSLYLEIDADIFNDQNNKYPNGAFFVIIPGSEIGKANQELSKFKEELPNDRYIYQNANDAEKNKSSVEYKEYIQQRENEYNSFLKDFIAQNNTTELFKNWINDHLKYESWRDLMRYRWIHPTYNKIVEDSFQIPKDYFSFLGDYDMNDNKLFSRTHIDFLHELSMYSSRNPKDSLIKARVALKEKQTAVAGDILKNMIRTNVSGFTCDLFTTKFYLDILNGQQIDIFNAVYDSGYTTQPYFLNTINEEYINLKKLLSNKNTDGAKLSSLKTSITTQLIDSIAAKYKNKVIYVDFWAPWCSPCMQEMPFSKEIQEYYKNENVVFLFLASRCKEDSRKSTIANKKLTGEHMLLTDDQFNVLSSILGISGIPHYSLIDKSGKIYMKNAPRPSDIIELKNEIEKLIKNK